MEDVKAKFSTAIIENLAHIQWVIGELMTSPPTDFSLPTGNRASWIPLNVELANLLSHAIVSPLAAIIEQGITQAVGAEAAAAIRDISTTLATSFITNPPDAAVAIAPMAIPLGDNAALDAFSDARRDGGQAAIASAVAAAVNNVPVGHCQQEFIACAILILGATKAVHSIPFPLPVGLTKSSMRAAGAAAGVGAHWVPIFEQLQELMWRHPQITW